MGDEQLGREAAGALSREPRRHMGRRVARSDGVCGWFPTFNPFYVDGAIPTFKPAMFGGAKRLMGCTAVKVAPRYLDGGKITNAEALRGQLKASVSPNVAWGGTPERRRSL